MSLPYQGDHKVAVIGERVAIDVGGKEMKQEGWIEVE